MFRHHRFTARGVLALALTFGSAAPPALLPVAVMSYAVTQTACGPNTLEKLNTTLNQTAHALEAAIDTNGRLYEAGAYGAKGSPEAIAVRQRAARVVHDSNEYLIQAVDIAKTLTKETFEGSKIAILEKLSLAAAELSIGHPTIDLVLQSVATLINQAVAIAQLFKAADVNHIKRTIPALDEHLKSFARVREINTGLEVFAE
jgi:hypothetical protein